jgi:hypothetical protein
MKTYRIRLRKNEYFHLINVMGARSVTTAFGPAGAFVTERSEGWVVEEIAKLRGVLPAPTGAKVED